MLVHYDTVGESGIHPISVGLAPLHINVATTKIWATKKGGFTAALFVSTLCALLAYFTILNSDSVLGIREATESRMRTAGCMKSMSIKPLVGVCLNARTIVTGRYFPD